MLEIKWEKVAGKIEKKLSTYCKDNVFSAASIAFYCSSFEGGKKSSVLVGSEDDIKSADVDVQTLFDLASLTKPLATLLSVLTLIEKGKLSWTDRIKDLFLEHDPAQYAEVTVEQLLCHSSGLPAHRDYWKSLEAIDGDRRKSWITDAILSEPKNYQTETSHLYSDLGYILLGFIVEQKSGLNLAQFFEEHIAKAVGVEDKLYFPPQSMREGRFVATRTLEGELLRGVVHDDNCRVMGGICGHAGLFGTSLGVLTLCQEIINVWMEKKSSLPFSSDLLKMATKRRKNSEWTAGFNLVSEQGSSSGSYFSDKSIGHLGFTGTSFWLDPVREVVVVLLTNRVIKGSDQEKIKQMRPEFHDYIQELLGIENQLPS